MCARIPFLGLLLLLAGGTGCAPREPLELRLERDLLTRQREALLRELQSEPDEIDSDLMIVIPSPLIDRLIDVALPIETLVSDRIRVVVDSGGVDFESGLAMVRLSAEVSAPDRPNVAARIRIAGILQVLGVEDSGNLSLRVEILGWQTQDVRVGNLSPPAGRLLDELASRPLTQLNELLSYIEIPVQLLPMIPLPRVAENEISIPATDVPLHARVDEVRVGGGRLWVHVSVSVPPRV